MPLEFSHIADDLLIEILGNLPALAIVRFRRVCRRILLASKERSVWINAFSIARCPIPDVNVNTMSTTAIENLLVRMEIMDSKWSGIRPTVPREIGANTQPPAGHCVSMPPYVLFIKSDSSSTSYRWYRVDNLEAPVLEYQHGPSIHCHATDTCGNTLNIAYMESLDGLHSPGDKTTRLLKFVKFEISKEIISKTVERDILWTNFTIPRGPIPQLKLLNGYVITLPNFAESRPISLLHIDTGKMFTCPSYVGIEIYEQFIASSATFSYFIQRSGSTFFFCEFPPEEEIETSTDPLPLRLTHSGSFPQQLEFAHLFPRSAFTFIVIGLSKSHDAEDFVGIHFITVNLSQHSPSCDIHEDFCYEAKGQFLSYMLAQCSSTSKSTLGVLSLLGHSPTHTATGIRIARTSTRPPVFHLGIRVDFGVEGDSSPKIDLIELDLVALNDIEEMALVNHFNPYTGKVIIEVRERMQFVHHFLFGKKLIMTDYASP